MEQIERALKLSDMAVENQAKACEAAMIAAKAFDRFVSLLEKTFNLVVAKIEKDEARGR